MRPANSTEGKNQPLRLEWLPGHYAVCRLAPDQAIPSWAQAGPERSVSPGEITRRNPVFVSITRTDRELSIVIDEALLPETQSDVRIQRGFVAMRIAGALPFDLVGVIAKLTGALAVAGVPVFVVSTFETDHVLVNAAHQSRAADALKQIGILSTP